MSKAPNKKELRSQADKLWFLKLLKRQCEVCGKSGQLQVHHFFPKGNFGHLRYDLENGVTLCSDCHFTLHFKGDPSVQEKIIKKRGQKWYKELEKKAREKQKTTTTVGWYKENIEKLK